MIATPLRKCTPVQHSVRPSTALQSIPQYVEVPPSIEAKRIVLFFSTSPSYLANHLLLNDKYKLLIFFWLLADYLLLHSYDPCNHTNEGPF